MPIPNCRKGHKSPGMLYKCQLGHEDNGAKPTNQQTLSPIELGRAKKKKLSRSPPEQTLGQILNSALGMHVAQLNLTIVRRRVENV